MTAWLVKSEPGTYSWQRFLKEGSATWDGVRNYQARNNLSAMEKGDQVLFYHSNVGQEVVGLARVTKESYPDPTTEDPRWLVVDLKPVRSLESPVPLSAIKSHPHLKDLALVRHSRLSVMPVSPSEFKALLNLSRKKRDPAQ